MSPDFDLDAGLAARLDVAANLAKKAGELLREGWGKRPSYKTKAGDKDLVTEYDEASERCIVQGLVDAFPEDGLIGEEGTRRDETGGQGLVWHIDPLDGTANFAHSLPTFSVSIGLMHHGKPVLGVVHAPVFGWTFEGIVSLSGNRLTRDGEDVGVSNIEDLSRSLLATGFPYSPEAPHPNFSEFQALSRRVHGIRRLGSAAMDLAFVACGHFDGYWERGISSWDLAAGAALVLAGGGQVSEIDGTPFVAETGQILATNGHLHRDLGKALEAVATADGTPWP